MSATTTSTQESMSLATAHEWKYLAQKAAKQRDAALARAKTAETALAEWKLLGRQESERAEAAIVRAQTAEAALAALAALQTPCVWRLDDDNWWQTGCGMEVFVRQGDFCPNCGHVIETQP